MSLITRDNYYLSAKGLVEIISEMSSQLIGLDMIGLKASKVSKRFALREMRKAYKALEHLVKTT